MCNQLKVHNLRKETDILMEKHVLNKIKDNHSKKELSWDDLPCIKVISTFKDTSNLYFLSELLVGKREVWENCRSFGLISDQLIRFTFYQICRCVKYLHDLQIVHRDLKVIIISNLYSLKICFIAKIIRK